MFCGRYDIVHAIDISHPVLVREQNVQSKTRRRTDRKQGNYHPSCNDVSGNHGFKHFTSSYSNFFYNPDSIPNQAAKILLIYQVGVVILHLLLHDFHNKLLFHDLYCPWKCCTRIQQTIAY